MKIICCRDIRQSSKNGLEESSLILMAGETIGSSENYVMLVFL